jgi:DNA polymerase-3 subunit delta
VKLRIEELSSRVRRGIPPVVLISSDETLLVEEAAAQVRAALLADPEIEHQRHSVDARFNWAALAVDANSLSLFSQRRLVELRCDSAKPGKEGGAVFADWAKQPPQDTTLLVLMPRVDAAGQKAAWYKAMDAAGWTLPIWPPEVNQLPGWVAQRLKAQGLPALPTVAAAIAERSEGNLWAATQEIEKLALLALDGALNEAQALAAVTGSARFDVFQLADAVLAGDASRSLKIVRALREEGVEAPMLVWALQREMRTLAQIQAALEQGRNPQDAFRSFQIWPKRQPAVQSALRRLRPGMVQALLQRAAALDRMSKGVQSGPAVEDALVEWILRATNARRAA